MYVIVRKSPSEDPETTEDPPGPSRDTDNAEVRDIIQIMFAIISTIYKQSMLLKGGSISLKTQIFHVIFDVQKYFLVIKIHCAIYRMKA